MGMMVQSLSPGVEDGQEADPGSQVSFLGRDLERGFLTVESVRKGRRTKSGKARKVRKAKGHSDLRTTLS